MGILEDRIAKLEKQVQDLQGSLKLGPQQAGPLPGWFRAAHIEGNQMLINMTDSKVGVSPRISVTDIAGLTRVEMGNLASYTGPNGVNSPAQYGLRANDSTGNAIFDSLGLIGVVQSLGVATNNNSGFTITAATPTIVTGVTLTINFTRQSRVLILARSTAIISGAVGNYGYGDLYVDGVVAGTSFVSNTNFLWDKLVPGYTNSSGWTVTWPYLSIGSHTFDYRVYVDAGQTWLNYYTSIQAILMGA